MPDILLIEDDASFGYILSEYLRLNDFEVMWCKQVAESREALEQHTFQVAILDIMLPDGNGYELAEFIRQTYPDLPFLFLSAKVLKVDKLKGYKLGADDYITKPVDEELLLAKLRVILNRKAPQSEAADNWLTIGMFQFHPGLQQLQQDTTQFSLTRRESELLHLLYRHKGQLLPRNKALAEIWHSTDEFSRKSMDVFISKLRRYLAADATLEIRNIHGKGFTLMVK